VRYWIYGVGLAATISLWPANTTFAAPAVAPAFCGATQVPRFQFGFATLKSNLGPIMGDPVECEHPNAANGDTLQRTTTGLAFYRKSTNTPTFTDGYNHWAMTPYGLVSWTGQSIDPPATPADSALEISLADIAATLGQGLTADRALATLQWRDYESGGNGVPLPRITYDFTKAMNVLRLRCRESDSDIAKLIIGGRNYLRENGNDWSYASILYTMAVTNELLSGSGYDCTSGVGAMLDTILRNGTNPPPILNFDLL
jgi:hypothetical protein